MFHFPTCRVNKTPQLMYKTVRIQTADEMYSVSIRSNSINNIRNKHYKVEYENTKVIRLCTVGLPTSNSYLDDP